VSQKPSELLLGVIDFFGVLIPGAILALLHGNFILHPLGLSLDMPQSAVDWIPTFFISFVLGHLLLGFSVPFNQLAAHFPSKETTEYEQAVRDHLKLPLEVKSRTNLFYSAFSFIRIASAGATTELERQAAEYKLFRSLTLLFLLDIPLCIVSRSFTVTRLVTDLLILALSALHICLIGRINWRSFSICIFRTLQSKRKWITKRRSGCTPLDL